jgi:hypothetical protein
LRWRWLFWQLAWLAFYLLSEQAMILRVLAVLVGLALAAVVAWKTEPGQRFFTFANEAVVEAKKVVWPTRKETMQTTGPSSPLSWSWRCSSI